MSEYATEIRFRFYDDNRELNIKELQKLKAKDYLKIYQLMYQDLVEHQHLNFDELVGDTNVKESDK